MGKMDEFINMMAAAMKDKSVIEPLKIAVCESFTEKLEDMEIE